MLADPAVSSVRLVVNPEKMVIEEARRAYAYLQLYGYGVDAVVVNRVLPEEGTGEALRRYVEAQAGYLEEIRASFAPLPHPEGAAPAGGGLRATAAARRSATELYGGRDPAAVFYRGQTYRVRRRAERTCWSCACRRARSRADQAQHFGDQLVVQLGEPAPELRAAEVPGLLPPRAVDARRTAGSACGSTRSAAPEAGRRAARADAAGPDPSASPE